MFFRGIFFRLLFSLTNTSVKTSTEGKSVNALNDRWDNARVSGRDIMGEDAASGEGRPKDASIESGTIGIRS